MMYSNLGLSFCWKLPLELKTIPMLAEITCSMDANLTYAGRIHVFHGCKPYKCWQKPYVPRMQTFHMLAEIICSMDAKLTYAGRNQRLHGCKTDVHMLAETICSMDANLTYPGRNHIFHGCKPYKFWQKSYVPWMQTLHMLAEIICSMDAKLTYACRNQRLHGCKTDVHMLAKTIFSMDANLTGRNSMFHGCKPYICWQKPYFPWKQNLASLASIATILNDSGKCQLKINSK